MRRLMETLRRVLFSVLLASAIAQFARGDSPKITAVLTSSEVVVGETVQLQIQIDNAGTSVKPPSEIDVPGLQIHFTGKSTEMRWKNFTASSSITYNYTILPEKSGTYKIPPQSIRAGKDNLRTPELTLEVVDSPRTAAGTGSNRAPSGNTQAGEQVSGQGFTVQKLGEPERNLENIEGRSYVVFNYKTAISAARVGNFQIGPVEQKANILVPRRSSGTRRKPFDPFSEDPFSDPFFTLPFGGLMEQHEIDVKSDPVSLEVKALPAGAPPTFSGALGSFSMTAEANPKRVQIGDPITIKAAISGRGNFDRMDAPELSDERGWHKYPPSSNFKQDDDVGISGTKTFELVVSPNEKLTNVPPLAFSYFDPVKEKYVTLHSEAGPLIVEGNAPAASAIAGTSPSASTPPVPGGQQKTQDILHQINDRGKMVSSFAPVYARKEFWLAQLLPLTLALGVMGWKVQNVRASNRAALRAAQLQHERDELLRKLRRDQLAPREYFSDASRLVQLKTALKQTNIEPGTVDAETAARVFDLNAEQSERMRRLFATSDEFRYSGAGNGESALSSDGRRETLELIESLS
ncbi:MAG: hypothetical protein AUG81_01410 [Verrucomicrobia bacterium 13_1_20CM_4_54_11]|nr:MAG: hypothetical protein AUG81_01410 [Verrucomicrobia bacterium 13_1_20CM_4_54_11]